MRTILLLAALVLTSCTNSFDAEKVSIETPKQKASYALGQNIGVGLKSQKVDLDRDALMAGIITALDEKQSRLSPEEIRTALLGLHDESTRNRVNETAANKAAQAGKNKTEGEAYLQKNKARAEVKTTDSGLQYEVIKQGKGVSPGPNDSVVIHYTGMLIDGTTFDSSRERGKPAELKPSDLIPAWKEMLPLMKEGSHVRLAVPPSLGYGEQGAGVIGPNAVLIFDLELLKVVHK